MTSEEEATSKDSEEDMEVDAVGPSTEQEQPQQQQEMEVQNEPEEPAYATGWQVADDIYIPPPPQVFGEYDTKGPRLMIVKIVAKNFKSYAGSIVIGPFHKCFSSIVGPNGNGKSNAIDSMLFVFGYRANKIRTKKIAELIHNSNEHPNCNSCTVSVYFQQIIDKPGQDYDIVPDSEFVISRTAFKDSMAYYELNGKKVQFKEIAKCLRNHCVDLDHNRFLILQGEVEQIALMKPKGQGEGDTGMLEFLEDIIGTTRYKEPLQRLSTKLEFLTEQREEKMRRLKVVEKAKAELEKPMQEAVQYLKLENSITKLQHTYYQCKKYDVSKQLKNEEENKKELDKDYNKLMDEIKTVHSEKDEKTKDFKEKSKKWDKLQQQKDALQAQTDEMRKKDSALQAEAEATNKRRKENKETVKNEKNKLEELQRIPAKNTKDIKECEKLQAKYITEQETEEAALVALMSGLKEKTEPLIKKRALLEKELVSQRKIVDEAKSAYDIAKSKLDLYMSDEHTEKEKVERLKESIKLTSERLAETKKKLTTIEPKIPATEKSLQQAQQELEHLKNRENELNMRLRNTRMKYDEQKSAMNAGTSRNRILNELMREKREGRLPGIFGRLGDLGGIDPKYDVAISTACGPLDNIVVDTVTTATQCIEFLRRGNLGRATFIALEKQQRFARQCQEKIRTPENVHRLFDLIKVDNKDILPAFYYALQNTLVAIDLDQATRIAYGAQRYRVVTLKGELIELSGTMSGGGRQVSRGRMGQKAARSEPTAEDIGKLQQELDQVFEEYNQVKMKQPPLENQIHALSMALQDMIVDRDKYKIDINQLSVEEPNMKKQLQEQEKKIKALICDPAKIQQLTEVVKETKKKFVSISEISQGIENEVAQINHQIDEISGNRVKEQQKKINTLNKNVDKAKGEICRLQVAIKTAERNAKKTEQRIETLEADIKSCEKRIYDITKEKKEIEGEYQAKIEELEKVNENLSERDELAKILKADLEKLQMRESKMKALKIDLDQKLNIVNKTLKELRYRIPDLTKAIQNLKLQNIPNEEAEVLDEIPEEELKELDIKTVIAQLQRAKEKLPTEIPNMQIIEQFREQNELYLKRFEKVQKITEERNSMRDSYSLAIRRRMEEFNDGFNMITGKLKEMYRMITLGGDAELELVDSLDPFSEGIIFSVRPPKKSWKQIQNLSGGEKTLSSLALVFALHHYKPTPFYFMDEIDAALDFKNVSIVASYIKERTKNAQFIVISHRSDMFELADYLVGIFKVENCSQCAALDIKKFNTKVGIVEQPRETNFNQNRFLSQPISINPNSLNGSNENGRSTNFIRPIPFPATCPGNINIEEIENIEPTQNENQINNENQENANSSNMNLSLGEISLPPTPMKQTSQEVKEKNVEKQLGSKSKINEMPPSNLSKKLKRNFTKKPADDESDNQSSFDNNAADEALETKRQKVEQSNNSEISEQTEKEVENKKSPKNNTSDKTSPEKLKKTQEKAVKQSKQPAKQAESQSSLDDNDSGSTTSSEQQRNNRRRSFNQLKQTNKETDSQSSDNSSSDKSSKNHRNSQRISNKLALQGSPRQQRNHRRNSVKQLNKSNKESQLSSNNSSSPGSPSPKRQKVIANKQSKSSSEKTKRQLYIVNNDLEETGTLRWQKRNFVKQSDKEVKSQSSDNNTSQGIVTPRRQKTNFTKQSDKEVESQSSDNNTSEGIATPRRQKRNFTKQSDKEIESQSSDNNTSEGIATPRRQKRNVDKYSKKEIDSQSSDNNTSKGIATSRRQKRNVDKYSKKKIDSQSSDNNTSKEIATSKRLRNALKDATDKPSKTRGRRSDQSLKGISTSKQHRKLEKSRKDEEAGNLSSSDTNTSVSSFPRRQRNVRRKSSNQLDEQSEDQSSDAGNVRRTPRISRKPKFLEDMELSSPSSRKRRKQ